ncbi:uncharacterized protein PG998_001030 [Apiospora kogelbergensis]|uniref:uncharacterized protein n=1 Tax=Apiospora kogelbergensis TaxID=1337665 RepID=UPI003131B286
MGNLQTSGGPIRHGSLREALRSRRRFQQDPLDRVALPIHSFQNDEDVEGDQALEALIGEAGNGRDSASGSKQDM